MVRTICMRGWGRRWKSLLRRVVRSQLWALGGRFNPIVPVCKGEIDEAFWSLLRYVDPDLIYTYTPLTQTTIDRIDKEIVPWRIEAHPAHLAAPLPTPHFVPSASEGLVKSHQMKNGLAELVVAVSLLVAVSAVGQTFSSVSCEAVGGMLMTNIGAIAAKIFRASGTRFSCLPFHHREGVPSFVTGSGAPHYHFNPGLQQLCVCSSSSPCPLCPPW